MQNEEVLDPFDSPEFDEVDETDESDDSKMGRPPLQLSPEKRAEVQWMASFGIPQKHIAKHVGLSPKTLRRLCRQELDHAAYDANNEVLKSLFQMATTRHNVAAAIFWAKTRCAYRPGGAPYMNAPGALAPTQPKDQESKNPPAVWKVEVYDNSGEPNADY
jgi:hypothetical protein